MKHLLCKLIALVSMMQNICLGQEYQEKCISLLNDREIKNIYFFVTVNDDFADYELTLKDGMNYRKIRHKVKAPTVFGVDSVEYKNIIKSDSICVTVHYQRKYSFDVDVYMKFYVSGNFMSHYGCLRIFTSDFEYYRRAFGLSKNDFEYIMYRKTNNGQYSMITKGNALNCNVVVYKKRRQTKDDIIKVVPNHYIGVDMDSLNHHSICPPPKKKF